ncbi:SGNH/GDSL hydrolase family protein [Jiulongibacter sediminis]|uniref:SGNH/GDSL hydrolase family protein n=1 Tax=Jiulongibacter sediminis TaxID=1605367 RepID=UPI0026EAE419|nr:SGNH/GDSL hydrolase family protein [Jiulongibacter sediminis]
MKKLLILPLLFVLFAWQNPQKIWVALGDSITYLNEHPDETYHRVKKGYMTRTVEKLPNLNYINHGYNGWTAVRVAQKIEELGIQKADIYSIFLGTNDWWAGLPKGSLSDYQNSSGTETIAGAFRVIVDHLKGLNAEADFVIITPMQRSDFVYVDNFKNNAFGSYKEKNGQSLESIVELIRQIGQEENIKVIDLYHHPKLGIEKLINYKYLKNPDTGKYQEYGYPEYTKIPFDPGNDQYPYPLDAIGMTYDGLHPSDEGNELIAKLLAKALKD